MKNLIHLKSNKGQSLIEILVAVTVAFIMISGAASLIGVTLHGSKINKFSQSANLLAGELMDQVTSYAERKWNCNVPCSGNYGLYNLNNGSNNPYYIATTTSPFSWAPGNDTIYQNGNIFNRYFYTDKVSRDASGQIEATFNQPGEDPSTQKVTVVVSWNNNGAPSQISIFKYFYRIKSSIFGQNDWSGGITSPGDVPVSTSTNKFFDALNINYSAKGEIRIQ